MPLLPGKSSSQSSSRSTGKHSWHPRKSTRCTESCHQGGTLPQRMSRKSTECRTSGHLGRGTTSASRALRPSQAWQPRCWCRAVAPVKRHKLIIKLNFRFSECVDRCKSNDHNDKGPKVNFNQGLLNVCSKL